MSVMGINVGHSYLKLCQPSSLLWDPCVGPDVFVLLYVSLLLEELCYC